mmetsp:Transcript_46271/g.100600  ORF Transcript_46271/g.100600 Transcript_46271/m.100600 type:complete len:96 (+) Transcript_46271:43-330(+)
MEVSETLMPEAKDMVPQEQQRFRKKRRKRRSFLESLWRKVQKPEVILLSVWWFIMLVLVVYMAEMGDLIRAIWRPLAFLLAIPLLFMVILSCATW